MTHLLLAAALVIEPSTTARKITYREIDTPAIYTQLGYVTAVYLPSTETIMADEEHPIHCGNKEFFDVKASGHVLYIKAMDFPKIQDPNTGGKSTNVDIELASGRHMEFLIQEVSKTPTIHADLKVFVEEGDNTSIVPPSGPKFVPASELESLREALAEKDKAAAQMAKEKQDSVQAAAVNEVQSIKHGYTFYDRKGKEEFHPAVFRDDKFTYIEVNAQEAPSVWELKDGKLAKVDALLQDGKYTIQHLVDSGEMRVGKSSVKFHYTKE